MAIFVYFVLIVGCSAILLGLSFLGYITYRSSANLIRVDTKGIWIGGLLLASYLETEELVIDIQGRKLVLIVENSFASISIPLFIELDSLGVIIARHLSLTSRNMERWQFKK
jgi:hypothetical protein